MAYPRAAAACLLLLLLAAPALPAAPPTPLLFPNTNSAFSLANPAGAPFYRLISPSSPSLAACAAAAATWRNATAPAERCLSATRFRAPPAAAGQCHCYVLPKWVPLASPDADSALLQWPCSSPEDCSYNGECAAPPGGACACDAGWRGPRCGELDLLPVEAARPGLRLQDGGGGNVSTWGAPMLQDPATGTWHAWASEMLHACGINSWTTNSHIVHATAPAPGGPWTRREEVVPAFAHEPDVVRGPGGELVMVYSFWDLGGAGGGCTACAAGVTLSQAAKNGCGPNRTHAFRTMMAIAPGGFGGAWGAPVEIPQLSVPWDWNMAIAILPNRTAIGLLRALYPWRAENYSDPQSWKPVGGSPQGPPLRDSNAEDPALWLDSRRGALHAVFHAMDVPGAAGLPHAGGHAYSLDGAHWVYTGTAYGASANYSDGSWQAFARRERPHVLLGGGGGGGGGAPVALSNGVQYAAPPGVACAIGGQPSVCDPVFTLVAPIAQR